MIALVHALLVWSDKAAPKLVVLSRLFMYVSLLDFLLGGTAAGPVDQDGCYRFGLFFICPRGISGWNMAPLHFSRYVLPVDRFSLFAAHV